MTQIVLKSFQLGTIYSVTSNVGINATYFPSKRMFMFLKGDDEVWIDSPTLEDAEKLFHQELKQLAVKQRGGFRVGAGRPRSSETKKAFRVTDAEKEFILKLREVQSQIDLPKDDILKSLIRYAELAKTNLLAFVTGHTK